MCIRKGEGASGTGNVHRSYKATKLNLTELEMKCSDPRILKKMLFTLKFKNLDNIKVEFST